MRHFLIYNLLISNRYYTRGKRRLINFRKALQDVLNTGLNFILDQRANLTKNLMHERMIQLM